MPEPISFQKKVLIAVSISALILAILFFLGYVISVLLLIFAGILLSVLLRALSRILQRYVKISDNIAILMVTVVLLLLVGGLGMIMGPNLSDGISELSQKIPNSIAKLEDEIRSYPWGDKAIKNIEESAGSLFSDPQTRSKITGIFSSSLMAVANILIIIIIGLYGAHNPKLYTNSFLYLFPEKKQKRVAEIIDKLEQSLIWWMAGRFSSMAVVGILTFIGLLILGIPLPFTLAVIAAILSFVPNIGPVVSTVPAALLALMESPSKALYVIILYILIQTIESYVITPLIQKRAVSIPPAMLISVQIMIGIVLGIFGLILATPLMVLVIVLIQTIYVQDVLGHKVTVLGDKKPRI